MFYSDYTGTQRFYDLAVHLILPVLAVALPLSAIFFRYIRAEMIDVLNSNHILAARGRAISRRKLYYKYVLKSILLPVITLSGTIFPLLLSGAVVVETIFSLPGIGRLMVHAALSRDYPVILAAGFLSFMFVIIGNLLADIGYLAADPRIRSATVKIPDGVE